MKKLTLLIFTAYTLNATAQSNIGINTATPDASSILDITHTNRGLLIPRIALTASNLAAPVTAPALSLLIFNTATAGTFPNDVKPGYYYWDGANWVGIGTGNAWALLGNAGTTAGTNFIGTTDAVDFITKTNGVENMRITTAGNVGIGTTAPIAKLDVAGNIQVTQGTYINGTSVNSGNTSLILGNNSSTENYSLTVGVPNASETGLSINKLTGYTIGSTIQFIANNLFRITNTGNVGIANANPTELLDVAGNIKFSNALMPAGNAGTTGQVLTSAGAGVAPTWGASAAMPAGLVLHFANITAPAGYLECNGQAVSRATYAALFSAIGTLYGVGDGSTTFNVPDLRGEFIRGADNARGVDAGRVIGTAQADMLASHSHMIKASANGCGCGGTGPFVEGGYASPTSATGGVETRPRNVAMMPCVKF
jgi:phage-related tail fiber protein